MSRMIQQSFLSTLALYGVQNQRAQLSLFYLDPMIQDFVKGLYVAEKRTFDLGWNEALIDHFGEENLPLLYSFTLRKIGGHYILTLKDSQGDVFMFQRTLQKLLNQKGMFGFRQFIKEKLRNFIPFVEQFKLLSLRYELIQSAVNPELLRFSKELFEMYDLMAALDALPVSQHPYTVNPLVHFQGEKSKRGACV